MSFAILLNITTLHANGIVHRDFKPENIGNLNGRLVALDLGMARVGGLNRMGQPQHTFACGRLIYVQYVASK